MKKTLSLLLAALLLAAPFAALAEDDPAVSDTAGVLDDALAADIQSLDRQISSHLNLRLRVITKHFLGGAQASAFAEEARQSSGDPDNTILLVMVIGEERYAASIGESARKAISPDTMNNLLASAFRQPFLNRDYNGALSALTAQVAGQLQKASPEAFDTGAFKPEATKAPAFTRSPLDGFFREPDRDLDNARRYQEEVEDVQEGRGGLSMWQIALIGFILFKLFGGNRRTGKKSGCGPLGWILGAWGISKFFGFRK